VKKSQLIGLVIVVLVIAGTAAVKFLGPQQLFRKPPDKVTLAVYVGGEKAKFLANPKVVARLDALGVAVNASKAGSIEMATTLDVSAKDAIWPSNQVASEMFRKRGTVLAEENVFNSPLVFYTYDVVADALIKLGIVEKRNESYYLVDYARLHDLIMTGKKWSEIGLPQLYGKVSIFSTDPTRSNSGNMFAGYLANLLNGGEVAGPDALPRVLPKLKEYFGRMGFMEPSSADLFENFLKTGVGSKPIIVGYESQLVEFALANKDYQPLIRAKIRTVYPVPTLWSSHPVIALTPRGKRLIEAMKDPALQRLAWEEHGFRSGVMGVQNDPKVLSVTGVPETIESVIGMPNAETMTAIVSALSANANAPAPGAGPTAPVAPAEKPH
jgi:hypothetical protein